MNRRISTATIAALKPCEDRFNNWKKFYGDQTFDIVDFLLLENISHHDKKWVALRLMPRFEVEVFAIDCAFSATAAAAAAAAAYATDDANATYYADAATAYAASVAAYHAVNAAVYAADAAANADAADADDAADAAGDAADAAYTASVEEERQIECLIYLIENMD